MWSSTADSSRAIGSISSSLSASRARRATCSTSSRSITARILRAASRGAARRGLAGERRPGEAAATPAELGALGWGSGGGSGGGCAGSYSDVRSSRIDCHAPTRSGRARERQPRADAQPSWRGRGARARARSPRPPRRARAACSTPPPRPAAPAALGERAHDQRRAPRAAAAISSATAGPKVSQASSVPVGRSHTSGSEQRDDHAAARPRARAARRPDADALQSLTAELPRS